MIRAVRRAAAVVLASMMLVPAAALGQDPDSGVTVDPDSPSGREYEIPLESARRGAEPGRDPGAPVVQSERDAPLFGAGISGKDGGGSASGSSSPAGEAERGGSGKPADPPDSAPERALPPAAVRVATSNSGAPDGDAGTIALVIAGGALVLGIGGGAGVLARRRAR